MVYPLTVDSAIMSEAHFQPRKARKTSHSDNPKTQRNRKAELAKSGYNAAEMRAKTAFRTNKCRHLAKLRRTPEWSRLTHSQREDREADVIEQLEKKHAEKLQALDALWNGSTDDNEDVAYDAHDDSPENTMESNILDCTNVNRDYIDVDDEDAWEDDEEDTVREVFKRYGEGYEKKIEEWEKAGLLEAEENNQLE
jgi:hypothetical protein